MAGGRRARSQSTSISVLRQNSTDSNKGKPNVSPETLAAMSKEQLRAECRKRGQRTTGNKSELLARLGYYKLAATSVQTDTEQRPRNGLHHPHPKEMSKSKSSPMEAEGLVLWRRPFTTVEYFFRELLILISTGIQKLFSYKLLAISVLLSILSVAVSYNLHGPHQPFVHLAIGKLAWWGWWVVLGICSSVGLGTGLHTFLLYLGPHIARVTLAAYECGGLNFPEPPYPNSIVCPADIDASLPVSIWSIMGKVRVESMLWGVGTALGELPPYFMARAAKLSGGQVVDLTHTDSSTDRAKMMVEKLVQKIGFMGILACASIPNPLFDLAGITCGHFLVPFWTFFGATVLGKAVIKMHIQKLFVIVAFNESLVGQALAWVERIPYIGPKLEAPLLEFLRNQKARLHKNDGSSDTPDNQGSILSSILEKFVLAMVLYFVVSIVNALAQNYSKRMSKKKGKKKE